MQYSRKESFENGIDRLLTKKVMGRTIGKGSDLSEVVNQKIHFLIAHSTTVNTGFLGSGWVFLARWDLITKGEPFSIIWREPALASYLLSNSPSVAKICLVICLVPSARASRPK